MAFQNILKINILTAYFACNLSKILFFQAQVLHFFLPVFVLLKYNNNTMSNLIQNKRKQNKPEELYSLIRKQVVQPYLYSAVKPDQQYEEDLLQSFLKQTPIIEGYDGKFYHNRKNRFYPQHQLQVDPDFQKKRGFADYRKIQQNMEVEEQPICYNFNDFNEDVLRKSNESSLQKIPFQHNYSHKNSENYDYMEIKYPNILDRKVYDQVDLRVGLDKRPIHPFNKSIQQYPHIQEAEKLNIKRSNQSIFQSNMAHQLRSAQHSSYLYATPPPIPNLQRQQKIKKLQQVGCNCRKSKCLKMYCQCFHLQIFCGENCNCVGCGNMEQTHDHQQAIIEALTRNPKAFQQENPENEGRFRLGVGLGQIKKGCRCKKTKCLKKYCQCYSTNSKCGKFCKCQGCENCA